MIIMVYMLEPLIIYKINIYEAKQLYSNQSVMVLLWLTTIIFLIWMFIILSKKLVSKLIEKSSEKVRKEIKNKSNNELKEIKTNTQSTATPKVVNVIQSVQNTQSASAPKVVS